jgi:hypothetical protein
VYFALKNNFYTVAGRAIGFALEQPLHVVTLACSASGILKQLEYITAQTQNRVNGYHFFKAGLQDCQDMIKSCLSRYPVKSCQKNKKLNLIVL